jgi:diguanylate cyclase (GGDEF)-like protein
VGPALAVATDSSAPAHPAYNLVERATLAMRSDPDASRGSAEAALDALKRTPDADLSIRARLILCDYYGERDSETAIRQLEFAIALLPQARRPGLRAGVLNCQGDILEASGDVAKAITYFEQAVTVATEAKDDEMLAQALFSRGSLVGIQGNFANGLADLRRAQVLFDRLKMPLHAITVHNNIAILYSRMGDYTQALEIYKMTLRSQRRAGMRRDSALTLHNIGRTNEHLSQWTSASQAFNESLSISRDLHYARGEAYALRGIAAATAAQGDPRAALEILDKAGALQKQIADASLGARIQLARGKALHQLHRLHESIAALEQARKYYADADALIDLGATLDALAEVHAEQGNWRTAYDFTSEARAIEQKLFRNRFDQRFATLKVEFDTAAKDKENELLTRENQANQRALTQEHNVQNLQAVVIALAILLLALLAVIAWRQRRASLKMRGLAMTDELTGVPNRRAALRALARQTEPAPATPCAVLIVDIDHFKSINDKHGHPEGDEALKAIAATLRSLVHEPASLGRLGGEEFIVILPSTSLEQARDSAEHIREQIAAMDMRRWRDEQRITVSIGVSVAAPENDNPTALMQRADAALYRAKRAGRNCVKTQADIEPETAKPTS